MSGSRQTAGVSFWHTVRKFQSDKLNLRLAARNTLGVAMALFGGIALGNTSGGLAVTTGALNVSFSDTEAPYLQRARRMLAASLLVGVAAFAGGLWGRMNVVAAVVATAWAFAAGMLVALSTTAADLGATSLVTLVVYMAIPLSFEGSLYAGLLAFAGGLLQTALALALWPLRRYVPERRALAALFHELSRAASSSIRPTEAPPASAESTAAQAALATLSRNHSIEAERYRLLLSQAERMRLTLLLLARLRVRIGREGHTAVAELLELYFERCSQVFAAIAASLRNGAPLDGQSHVIGELETLTGRARDIAAPESNNPAAMLRDVRQQMAAIAGQLRTAVDLAGSSTPEGFEAFERREARRPWRLQLGGTWATLRANLNFESAAFRHAVRLAACVGVGLALARGMGLHRAYWVPMTIAIVLKPDFTGTFSRGVLRLAGTFAGLLLATGLFHMVHTTRLADAALVVVMMFLMRWIGPANYGVFVVAVTSLVVFLVAMTGVAPRPVMVARMLNTTFGGAIALLAYWLWPTWERTQVPEAFARLLDAYRASFRALRETYERGSQQAGAAALQPARDRARIAARLARSNLEASIDRLFAEPGTPPQMVALLSGMLASSHRMVHAVMALEAGLYAHEPVPSGPAFAAFANHVELTLYYLSAALRGSPFTREALPDLREDHHALEASSSHLVAVETDRIVNSLNTLSEEVSRWVNPADADRSQRALEPVSHGGQEHEKLS